MTIIELLTKGSNLLSNHNIENHIFETKQILKKVFNYSDLDLMLNQTTVADNENENNFFDLIKKRSENYPLQYLLGEWDFYTSTFSVGEGVLIPRPETELLVSEVISIINKEQISTVYDLCSGTGCIGLTVAKECGCDVYLFEKYDEAFNYLELNNKSLNLKSSHLVKGDILNSNTYCGLPTPQLIISNPPYINTEECTDLQKEVLHEPLTALDGGKDGLLFYRSIYEQFINSDVKYFCFECGENQSEFIRNIFGNTFNCKVIYDFNNLDRMVILERLV